jgi:predicted amidohydrolase
MIIKIAALQYPLGQDITLEDKLFLFRRQPDFICLPEYYFVKPNDTNLAEAADRAEENVAAIEKLSIDLGATVVGGSMPVRVKGSFANISMVYSRGQKIGSCQKVNLFGREFERGVVPGKNVSSLEVGGVTFGVLICADVLKPETFKQLKIQKAEVIFTPMTSPYRPDDTLFEKQLRDNTIFVRGAQLADAFIVKVGGVGTIFGNRLQGRSGVFAPWGILARTAVEDEQRKRILSWQLDLDEIREFKEKMVNIANSADE